MMQRYGQINSSLGRIRRRYVKKALPEGTHFLRLINQYSQVTKLLDDHPHFLRYATDLATVLRNTIFVDQVCVSIR
jgi:telomerase reverse transcriptase